MTTGSSERGQSLIELVVAIGVGVLFITAALGVIAVSLKLDFQNTFSQTAAALNNRMIDEVTTFANADWHNVSLATHSAPLSLATTTTFLSLTQSSSTKTIGGAQYWSSFMVSDVCRDNQNAFVACTAGTVDPSTVKITVATQWQQNQTVPELRLEHYLTRIRDRAWVQSDWSSGSSSWNGSPFLESTMGQGWLKNATNTAWTSGGQLTIFNTTKNLQTLAGNVVDPTYRYAWNDVVGWFDFRANTTVTIGSTITGYAVNVNNTPGVPLIGDLAMDCNTSPNGAVCGAPSTWRVVKDTSGTNAGILSGYAWNDAIGWVSFNCSDSANCQTSAPCPTTNTTNCLAAGAPTNGVDYNVRIDNSGNFYGWAWNDVVGWISFNCNHSQDSVPGVNYCLTGGNGQSTDYKVKTGGAQISWGDLESIPFNTARAAGAGFNTIMWQGPQPQPAGTNVKLQIATSNNINGPWNFVGPDGSKTDYYQPLGPGVPVRIIRANHNDQQYMAYRVILESDTALASTPTVTKVIINWSH